MGEETGTYTFIVITIYYLHPHPSLPFLVLHSHPMKSTSDFYGMRETKKCEEMDVDENIFIINYGWNQGNISR